MEPLLNFSEALQALREGKRLTRLGWNGSGLFVLYVPTTKHLNHHFELYNPRTDMYDTWVSSVSDLLAADWMVVRT